MKHLPDIYAIVAFATLSVVLHTHRPTATQPNTAKAELDERVQRWLHEAYQAGAQSLSEPPASAGG
jgi:hypothetical protein